jgi:hypothetical protein
MLKALWRCESWGVIRSKRTLVGTETIKLVWMCSSANYRQRRNGAGNITVINSDVILAGFTIETGNTWGDVCVCVICVYLYIYIYFHFTVRISTPDPIMGFHMKNECQIHIWVCDPTKCRICIKQSFVTLCYSYMFRPLKVHKYSKFCQICVCVELKYNIVN